MNPPKPTPNFSEPLFHVAEQTFGELAFMLVIPREVEPTTQDPPAWGYAARVEFTGPFDGEMHIAVTNDMLQPLAANMLGIDVEEEPPEGVQREDALKELLNVICGNLLPAMAGDQVIFQIGAPTLLSQAILPASVPERTLAGRSKLHLDSGVAEIVFFVDEDAELPDPENG